MSNNVGSAKAKDDKKTPTTKGSSGKRKSAARSAGKTVEPSLNMTELEKLAELVDEHGFTDFEFENENIRVRLSKNPAPQIIQAVQPNLGTSQVAASSEASSVPQNENAVEPSVDADLYQITSPIVGTFYRSPAPDKDPYVKKGSHVSADSIVCIVEAMKLMNEIEAETTGEVVKIYAENGQPVEYGQPLFGIRK